ncbi:MAG: alpha/beta hydrolase [Caulobacteraceae bacterium]|nr:alpha/beta hydrolase [Caulobacter sp.]
MLAERPAITRVPVEGAEVEVRAWGPRGGEGLLLLHGAAAHGGWWDFIAPFFAREGRRVAALTWSGMGASGWRERYGFDLFAAEALAAAEAAGLQEGAHPPDLVAHSFGGAVACHLAASAEGARFRRYVLADVGVRPPERRFQRLPARTNPNRAYADEAAALARFRLMPEQACANLYAVDHIARGGLRRDEDGWRWAFDPFMWAKLDRDGRPLAQEAELAQARAPLAFVHGERSALMDAEVVAYTRAHARPGSPVVAVPEAAHHLMLDQPLGFVAALRALFAGWAVTPA